MQQQQENPMMRPIATSADSISDAVASTLLQAAWAMLTTARFCCCCRRHPLLSLFLSPLSLARAPTRRAGLHLPQRPRCFGSTPCLSDAATAFHTLIRLRLPLLLRLRRPSV